MQRFLYLLFTVCFFLAACTDNPGNVTPVTSVISRFLNAASLPTQTFSIDITRDTSFVLAAGTHIHIPAGAIKSSHKMVKLELKEAITPEQILAAGLTTQSDGKLLSSGGMLYINPAKGEEATIVKPIKASIPTKYPVTGMMAFKGEETDKGINWKNPKPLLQVPDTMIQYGKTIFLANCNSCHNPYKDATGPALYGSLQRWGGDADARKDMYRFIRNSGAMIASGDPCANCLYEKWKTNMTAFPSLTDYDLDAMFRYIDEEGRKRLGKDTALVLPYNGAQCRATMKRLHELELQRNEMAEKRKPFLQQKNEPAPVTTSNLPSLPVNSIDKKMVNIETPDADYYNIEINSFGWYNLDFYIGDAKDSKQSSLTVTVTGDYGSKLQLLLVLPDYKVMTAGGKLDDGKRYGFDETNGNIILPQNAAAYILAFGEASDKEQLYFSVTKFTTALQQDVKISLAKSDSSTMMAAIGTLNLRQTALKITRDTTAIQLKTVTKELDSLYHTVQHCPCYLHSELDRAKDTAIK